MGGQSLRQLAVPAGSPSGWRRAQRVCTRRLMLRPPVHTELAWKVSVARRDAYQVSAWRAESGRLVVSSSWLPHRWQSPFWARIAMVQDSASWGAGCLRLRSAQYWVRAGSSGDDLPVTTTCRTIFVQAYRWR